MSRATTLLMMVFVALLAVVAYEGNSIIANQRAMMKAEFHRDGIALVALFGEEGLEHLQDTQHANELSRQETFATGLLLQRFIAAYWLRQAFTEEEWHDMVVKDGRLVMRSPLLRERWSAVRQYYPPEIQKFIEHDLMQVAR